MKFPILIGTLAALLTSNAACSSTGKDSKPENIQVEQKDTETGKVIHLTKAEFLSKVFNYEKNPTRFTLSFFSIIRMSLRLLCESAMKDQHMTDIRTYIKQFFPDAKKLLSQDIRTYLSNYNINDQTLPQLLHTGAHDYTASRDRELAIGISIILGAMLSLSHGKQA